MKKIIRNILKYFGYRPIYKHRPKVFTDPFTNDRLPKNLKFESWEIEVFAWENQISNYDIPLENPSYDIDEEYVMHIPGAKGLRYADESINKDGVVAPYELVLKECIRRYNKGLATKQNNYIKLIVRTFERIKDGKDI